MPKRLLFESARLTWPSEAHAALINLPTDDHLRRGILNERIGYLYQAEIQLLAALQHTQGFNHSIAPFELLSGLHQRRSQLELAKALIKKTDNRFGQASNEEQAALKWQTIQIALAEKCQVELHPNIDDSPLEVLQQFQQHLVFGNQKAVKEFLANWPSNLTSPEALEFKARALKSLGLLDQAVVELNRLLSRATGSAAAWQAAIEINLLAGQSNGLMLNTACRLFPRNPGIASHRALISLNERRPAIARRSSYRERILYSLGKPCHSYHQSNTNLISAYDQTGRSDLTPFLHQALLDNLSATPALHANVVMQLASQACPNYAQRAEMHGRAFPEQSLRINQQNHQKMRVGFVSPDLYYHPVGRFIQILLAANSSNDAETYLISTGKTPMPRLQELAQGKLLCLNNNPVEQRLEQIQNLALDVAVDLTGWTGDNNGLLFSQRLAPLQVNYLGYFASTGLPSMDVWLGDQVLFPNPMQEWHSERIVRLPRPFLAWQPDQHLPEGRVEVPPAPSGPITFGCFNHVRKLSASTLSLWARILQAIPGARLALKAYTSDDPGVVALVEKRMRRCGLDPAAVIWLPTCPKSEDHLRQYGLIDIALDPFPNGGCTTTCEALWMGVPVITLLGSHYVSRMAAAVLHGAHLPEWVASSQHHYLELACRAADQLSSIRRGRQALRAHLQASPLGDAADLAHQLWQCFEQLV